MRRPILCDSWVVSEETRYFNEEIDYDEQVFRVGIVPKYKISEASYFVWVVSEETRYINEEIDYDEQVFRVGIVPKYKISEASYFV